MFCISQGKVIYSFPKRMILLLQKRGILWLFLMSIVCFAVKMVSMAAN